MDFLHYDINASTGETIEVTLDAAANVQLLDDSNYALYQSGKEYHYFGGYARTSPFRLSVPRTEHWNLVVDLGGYIGQVRAEVRILQGVE